MNVITLKCFSMSNRECRVRPAIMNMSSNEPLFCPYSILVNKCSGSCNNINDPFAKLCIHVVKNMNIKLFNLMSRTNEGRHMSWHKTCACNCRLDASVCNNKERCNNDKWRCGGKELIDKGKCDDEFIWNPTMGECECHKSCDVGEYLVYESCKCRKRLIDILVLECEDKILNTKDTTSIADKKM